MNCTNPRTIKDPNHPTLSIQVPCGKCMACRITKTREWSLRLYHENASSLARQFGSCFIGLSYAPEYVPTTPCGKMVLRKEDLQKFLKRLRENLNGRKIKYFACGEYGDEFDRPHFHVILFGVSLHEADTIRKSWKFGFVDVGTVTPYSIQYVTGYVRKKLDLNGMWLKKGSFCYPLEFHVNSHGLGIEFVDSNIDSILEYGIKYRGKNMSIPRYYAKNELIQKKFDKISEKSLQERQLKNTQLIHNALFEKEYFEEMAIQSLLQESNIQKEQNLKAQNKLFNQRKN